MEQPSISTIYASLNYAAGSEAAKGFIRTICGEAAAWEHEHSKLKKRRSAKDAASFESAIEAFVADVLRASLAGASGAYRSLNKNAFTEEESNVGYRSFMAAKDALVGLGLIAHAPGSPRYDQAFGGSWNRPGVASIFTATPELMRRASEALEGLKDLRNHFVPELPKQPLVLYARSLRQGRDKLHGDKMPIEPDDAIANKLRDQVQAINEFLAGFANRHVTIEGKLGRFVSALVHPSIYIEVITINGSDD